MPRGNPAPKNTVWLRVAKTVCGNFYISSQVRRRKPLQRKFAGDMFVRVHVTDEGYVDAHIENDLGTDVNNGGVC